MHGKAEKKPKKSRKSTARRYEGRWSGIDRLPLLFGD